MKILQTKDAPQPIGPYSQGIELEGLLFLSGQVALNPVTGEMAEGLVQQTHQVLENARAVLESAGSSLANVVKTTVYLRSMEDFAEFNRIYGEYFKDVAPARSTVEVSGLPKNALIEIDIIACK